MSTLLYPPRFQILPNPLPSSLPLTSTPLLFLLSCFSRSMGDYATFDVLICLMVFWVHKCRALVPLSLSTRRTFLCFMQQGIKSTDVWHIMWFLLVLWFDITYTETHTQRQATQSWTNRLTHPYKYEQHLLFAHSSSLLYWMNNSLISSIYFPLSFPFKNYSLLEVLYLLIRCNNTKFFLWNTNNTDRNGVNK